MAAGRDSKATTNILTIVLIFKAGKDTYFVIFIH